VTKLKAQHHKNEGFLENPAVYPGTPNKPGLDLSKPSLATNLLIMYPEDEF
jgi:hypothetical protein